MGVRTRRNKRKKYQYRANSRRKQIKMKKKFNPLIECLPIKKAWDKNKPAPSNFADMGLIYDLDRGLPVNKNQQTSEKQPKKKKKKEKPTEVVQQLEEAVSKECEKRAGVRLTNAQVEYATAMLDKYGYDYKLRFIHREVFWSRNHKELNFFSLGYVNLKNEGQIIRIINVSSQHSFKMPIFQDGMYLKSLKTITHHNKHFRVPSGGLAVIYKAMVRDPRNYFQDTWKQIRTKVKLFVSNPRYFAPYLKERGMLKLEDLKSQDNE